MMGGYYGSAGPGNMMWGGGWWSIMVCAGIFFLLLVIGGIAITIWAASQNKKTRDIDKPSSDTSLDVLKRRYASGEIDKKQYDEIKQDLLK